MIKQWMNQSKAPHCTNMGRVRNIIQDPNFTTKAKRLLRRLRWKTILAPLVKERTTVRAAIYALNQLHTVFLKVAPFRETALLFKPTYPDRINRVVRIPTRVHTPPSKEMQTQISLPCFGLVKDADKLSATEAVAQLKFIKMSVFDACSKSNSKYLGCSVPPLKSAIYSIDQANEWMVRCRQAYGLVIKKSQEAHVWMDEQEKKDFERLAAQENNKPFQQFLIDRQTEEGWQVCLPLDVVGMIEKFTLEKAI